MRIRVVGSAGAGNAFDEILEADYSDSTAEEIWDDAKEMAVNMTGFNSS